jgi:hypothetical protein
VADLQIVTRDHPATLPAIAKFREYVVPEDTKLPIEPDHTREQRDQPCRRRRRSDA